MFEENKKMHTHIFHLNSRKAKNATEAEKNYVKNETNKLAISTRIKVDEWKKTEDWKSPLQKMIDKFGEKAIFETGFEVKGIKKPVIVKMTDIDIYGDIYKCAMLYYADGKYDFCGLDPDFIRSFDLGPNCRIYAICSVANNFVECNEIGMEEFAKEYTQGSKYEVTIFNNTPIDGINEDNLDSIAEYYNALQKSIELENPENVSDAIVYCSHQLEAIDNLKKKISKIRKEL